VRLRNPARWRAIDARLSREPTIWVATTRGDGRSHLVPIWYIWLEEKIYICTGAETQKFANLFHNQSVALSLPDPDKVIIIEGEAHVTDPQTVDILPNTSSINMNGIFATMILHCGGSLKSRPIKS